MSRSLVIPWPSFWSLEFLGHFLIGESNDPGQILSLGDKRCALSFSALSPITMLSHPVWPSNSLHFPWSLAHCLTGERSCRIERVISPYFDSAATCCAHYPSSIYLPSLALSHFRTLSRQVEKVREQGKGRESNYSITFPERERERGGKVRVVFRLWLSRWESSSFYTIYCTNLEWSRRVHFCEASRDTFNRMCEFKIKNGTVYSYLTVPVLLNTLFFVFILCWIYA